MEQVPWLISFLNKKFKVNRKIRMLVKGHKNRLIIAHMLLFMFMSPYCYMKKCGIVGIDIIVRDHVDMGNVWVTCIIIQFIDQ